MGSHTNYYLLILSLIRIKDELYRVKIPRLQPLIELLQTKTIEIIDYDEVIPDNRALANELGITVTKCNSWLKKLREKVRHSFYEKPLVINEIEYHVLISRHWREIHNADEKERQEENQMSFSLQVVLPVIPRIGEKIEFELADRNEFYSGTVYEIKHEVIGKKQQIIIFAHPYESDYYRWMRLKQEYNAWGREKYG